MGELCEASSKHITSSCATSFEGAPKPHAFGKQAPEWPKSPAFMKLKRPKCRVLGPFWRPSL
eukprot:11917349-Prorocentrum_lima.AAC.1